MHSFDSCLVHCVGARRIAPSLWIRICANVSGRISAASRGTLALGGAADHVHILISLPGTLSLAKALQLLKGNSSKWVPEYLFPSVKTLG